MISKFFNGIALLLISLTTLSSEFSFQNDYDPDTEEDESVIGTAEQTYTSSLSTLETDYKTKLGKITKAYTDVAGDDENKGSALTTFETEKGTLTTEYEAAKKAIEDAYYGIVGKEGTDEEEGIIGSAKTAYDTLMNQLNLDYKAETGAFTTAYEKTKKELDTTYATDTGALTGEYDKETEGITSETGYTDAHGKFLTGKEWYEKEEKELIERDKEKPPKKFTAWFGNY